MDQGGKEAAPSKDEDEEAREAARTRLREHKKRYRERKKQDTRWQREQLVTHILQNQEEGAWPPPEQTLVKGLLCGAVGVPRVDWDHIHPGIDPARGGRLKNVERGLRKRQQVESLLVAMQAMLLTIAQQRAAPPQARGAADPLLDDNDDDMRSREQLHVVDFCAGSGNASLVLAALLPHCNFTLLDKQAVALALAERRAREAGLTNVRVVVANLTPDHRGYDGPMDVGMAVHACGRASDMVHDTCLSRGVPYLICPCCIGKLVTTQQPPQLGAVVAPPKDSAPHHATAHEDDDGDSCRIGGPRSSWLRAALSAATEPDTYCCGDSNHDQQAPPPQEGDEGSSSGFSPFGLLASGADHNHQEEEGSGSGGGGGAWVWPACRLLLEVDRCRYAGERHGYTSLLATMDPPACTPKHHVLLGLPPGFSPAPFLAAASSPTSTHRRPPSHNPIPLTTMTGREVEAEAGEASTLVPGHNKPAGGPEEGPRCPFSSSPPTAASLLSLPSHLLSPRDRVSALLEGALSCPTEGQEVVLLHVDVGLGHGKGGFLLARAATCWEEARAAPTTPHTMTTLLVGIDAEPALVKAVASKVQALEAKYHTHQQSSFAAAEGAGGSGSSSSSSAPPPVAMVNVHVLSCDPVEAALEALLEQVGARVGSCWVTLFFPIWWTRARHHKRRLLSAGLVRVLDRCLPPSSTAWACGQGGVLLTTNVQAQADEAQRLFTLHAPSLTLTHLDHSPFPPSCSTLGEQQPPPASLPTIHRLLWTKRKEKEAADDDGATAAEVGERA